VVTNFQSHYFSKTGNGKQQKFGVARTGKFLFYAWQKFCILKKSHGLTEKGKFMEKLRIQPTDTRIASLLEAARAGMSKCS
jgi:hypothetical protein